jgi:DNA-binding NtrC family response regulator
MAPETVVDMQVVRILVIDDDEFYLDAVHRMLNRNGYEVIRAGRPDQALEIVRNSPPIHLILSDNQMPEMKGTQLIREVMHLSPQTGCMLMTGGVAKPTDAPHGVIVLKKPFSAQDLIFAVQAALAQSGSPTAAPDSVLPALPQNTASFAELFGDAIAKGVAKALAEERAPVFSPPEAAVYSKRSEGALRELRRQGKLPNAGTPNRILYRKADLDKL